MWFVTQGDCGNKLPEARRQRHGKRVRRVLQLVQPAGTEFWTLERAYRPTADPNNRDATFVLKNGVALYGGFGNETQRKERDWNASLSFRGDPERRISLEQQPARGVRRDERGRDGRPGRLRDPGRNADGGALQDTHGGGMINFGDPGSPTVLPRELGPPGGDCSTRAAPPW